MPASQNIALPLSSWGEFGLLVATRLKHRAMVVYCPVKQPNGTQIDVVLALPNKDRILLSGTVIDSDRQQHGDHETWVTRLSLKNVSERELSQWELLARQRPNRPSQAPRVAPVSQPPPSGVPRQVRTTPLDDLFDDLSQPGEPPPIVTRDPRVQVSLDRATACTLRREYSGAIAALEAAVSLAPHDRGVEAMLCLARARQSAAIGRADMAKRHVQNALVLDPTCMRHDDPLLNLVRKTPGSH